MNLVTKEKAVDKIDVISESVYRAIKCDSYSGLKLMAESPFKYYKQIVCNERSDKVSDDALRGSLVDCKLTCPDEFDNKFTIATAPVPAQTSKTYDFAQILFKKTIAATNEDGEVTRDFLEMFKESYDESGIKSPLYDNFLAKFPGSDLELYYKELRESINKPLIDLRLATTADYIVETLKTHKNTKDIINLVSNDRYTVYNQFPIEFEYKGVKLKCLLDKLVIDHEEKIVKPYDLKCSWEIDNIEYNYIKNFYYIQNAVYTLGVGAWMIQEGFEDYNLDPFRFIFAHSINQLAPIIKNTTQEDWEKAKSGFKIGNRTYMGLDEVIYRVTKHTELGIWNESIESIEQSSNGLTMNINYESN